MSHFDLKNWVTGGTKIRPGIPSNFWVKLTLNIESIWLSISSQFDSQYRVNLTLNIESIWLSISSQFDSQYRVNLTLNIESIWLSISSQFDSQYRVNLTLNFESIWLKYSPITRILFPPVETPFDFLGQNDSIFSFSVIYFKLRKISCDVPTTTEQSVVYHSNHATNHQSLVRNHLR